MQKKYAKYVSNMKVTVFMIFPYIACNMQNMQKKNMHDIQKM